MAKYIKAVEAAEKVAEATGINIADLVDVFAEIPAADVVPVVRCKDCIYTRKLYGRLVCKYGICSGYILREDFFCADGVKREVADD